MTTDSSHYNEMWDERRRADRLEVENRNLKTQIAKLTKQRDRLLEIVTGTDA